VRFAAVPAGLCVVLVHLVYLVVDDEDGGDCIASEEKSFA
jgi:hypothetical protein